MRRKSFPRRVIDQAESIAFPASLGHRPQVQGITIDGITSKDLDDAIWIEPQGDLTILSVHIADVAELVRPNTDLDKEAIARTQTLYLRRGNDPMLPKCLSEDKLSLLERQPRPTLTIEITLDNTTEVQKIHVFESWLSSQKRFSYPQAEAALKDPTLAYSTLIRNCWQWAEQLYQNRIHADNFKELSLPQGYYLDENGNLLSTDCSRFHGYLIIQEFMILANTAIAQWLVENNIPAIYRNHTHKTICPEQTHRFAAFTTAQSEADIRRILMSWLNPADYGPEAKGHFALNLSAYCHFTSPIRRLPDLINHRMVKAHLQGHSLPYDYPKIELLCQHINRVNAEQEQSTKSYFKEQQHQLYQRQLQAPERLGQLPGREFSLLLRYAIEEGQGQIVDVEASNRLQSGVLQVEDLFVLLILGDHPERQQQVMDYLQEHICDAPSIITIAQQQLEEWDSFAWVEHDHGPPFAAWLEVQINQQMLTTSQPAIMRNKPGARHQACLDWLIAYQQQTLVLPEERVIPPDSKVPTLPDEPLQPQVPATLSTLLDFKEGQNCISFLLEVCQGMPWPLPEYQIIDGEDGFRCECSLRTEDDVIVGTGIASSKKTAKHRAARDVVEKFDLVPKKRKVK